MEGCIAMVVVFGAFMFLGWIFFDKNDWGGKR